MIRPSCHCVLPLTLVWLPLALVWLPLALSAGANAEEPAFLKPQPEAVAKWRAMRFGMFIHWGPVSLTGQEIGWSRGRQTPVEKYDSLYKEFNPTKFDADAWAVAAKEAGMKYVIITTKHHDGFCLWPSQHTDYDIGESPFQRDVLKELSEACRRQGLRFGTYYSVCDWYHPDFPLGSPGGRTKKPNPNLDRYVTYLRNQVTELVTGYGPLCTMWFDVPQEVHAKHGVPTVKLVRQLQGDIMINNRAYRGFPGDHMTPEQRVGGFNRDRPWETCMTICRQWAWKPDDQMKSLWQCLQTLISTAGGDGNLLLNVGPMPDGRIEPRQVERLREMGVWLDKYGMAIYGTRGGPFKPGRWGASTCQENRIHLFVMNWPKSGPLELPAIGGKVTSSRTLSGGKAEIETSDEGICISLAEADRDPIATVIELTVDRAAAEISPLDVFLHGRPVKAVGASASNTFQKLPEYSAAKAIDGDSHSRWATDAGTHEAWIEVDLGKPTLVAAAWISEAFADRVQAYQLQVPRNGGWKTIHTGTTLGESADVQFEPVTTARVRLQITKATEGPTLDELQFFAPKAKERADGQVPSQRDDTNSLVAPAPASLSSKQ